MNHKSNEKKYFDLGLFCVPQFRVQCVSTNAFFHSNRLVDIASLAKANQRKGAGMEWFSIRVSKLQLKQTISFMWMGTFFQTKLKVYSFFFPMYTHARLMFPL